MFLGNTHCSWGLRSILYVTYHCLVSDETMYDIYIYLIYIHSYITYTISYICKMGKEMHIYIHNIYIYDGDRNESGRQLHRVLTSFSG